MRLSFRYVTRISFLLLLIFSFSRCGLLEKGPAQVKYPNSVNSEMQADYDRAEKSFQDKNYVVASREYQAYLQKWPYNRLSDEAEFRLGQMQILKQDYVGATQTFEALAKKTPDPSVASRSWNKAGISQYRLNNSAQALSLFQKVEGQYLSDHDKVKMGGLALEYLNRNASATLETKAYYYALLMDSYQAMDDVTLKKRYGNEAPPRKQVETQISVWAKAPAAPNQIDPRFFTYQPGVSGSYVYYKLGMTYYQAGNENKAAPFLHELVSRYPNTAYAQEARPILQKIGYEGKKEKKAKKGKEAPLLKVGVILPLTGKYELFGRSVLNGIECASGTKPGCTAKGNVQIFFRDDGGTPTKAVQAVEELVLQEKVHVIVGPLSSASALAAAQKAQQLGVVMISLAQKEGIPEVGSHVFRFSLTPEQQTKALLTVAGKYRGKKSLGIFYPATTYGKVFVEKFRELAPTYETEVVAAQSYKDSRKAENELRQLKLSISKASPEIPLGFNALVIPDSYTAVLNLLPQLKSLGIESVLLLGTNAWNDPQLASRSNGQLGGSVFLDIYFKESQNPRVRSFVQEYQTAFGQQPATLEAMGYDTIGFLGKVASGKKTLRPEEFREALMTTNGYEGVTGLQAFTSHREAQVRPYLLTVEGDQIKEVEK